MEFLLNGIDAEYLPSCDDETVQYLKRKCPEKDYRIVILPRAGFGFEKKVKNLIFSCKLNSDDVILHGDAGKYIQFNICAMLYFDYAAFLTVKYLICILKRK